MALDFDGTLIDADHTIHPAALRAIHRAAATGVVIATASGRSFEQQGQILGLSGLGAHAGVPQALTVDERTVWLLEDGAYRPVAAWNDALVALWEELLPRAEALAQLAQAELAARGVASSRSLSPEQVRRRGMLGFKFASEADAVGVTPWLAEFFAQHEPALMVSQNWSLIHVMARASGKGRALVALAHALGLAPAEVLAVGDRHNDIPMLDGTCGLAAAAVGNAVPEIQTLVRSVGGYVATGELGAGVAEIIERVLSARGR